MRLYELINDRRFYSLVNKYEVITIHFKSSPLPMTIKKEDGYSVTISLARFEYKRLGNLLRNEFIIEMQNSILSMVEVGCDKIKWHATYSVDTEELNTADKFYSIVR